MNTIIDIKQNNYQNIYRLFFQYDKVSKQQIARFLNLSLPTVVNNIGKLNKEGKIRECGQLESQGGRPAIAYELVKDAHIAIAVEIQNTQIKCAVLNLLGEIMLQKNSEFTFIEEQSYTLTLIQAIDQFITESRYAKSQILGIGLSVQGIAAKDGKSMLYSKAFPSDNFDIPTLDNHFDLPVMLFHDVKCAATAELWKAKYLNDAIYVFISEHLGGAHIINNQIDLGKNGFAGAFEHLQIYDNGNACYCGQKGCLETYCSLSALLQKNESEEQFFAQLRQKDFHYQQRWDIFLTNLAKGLNAVYLLLERDIILGGKIAPYLKDEDLVVLKQKMESYATFPQHDLNISIAQQQSYSTLIGAGLYFIKKGLRK
ncbi:putative NBD/HSP70 family sugar kinase [Cricetibacter osteomyelitidis]|uniref:Putative NBD/HSP70 family sugar kinase n=1 Tax=Cricetibacter osteomyelitidis TaxID=1521931 RepID=A0A4R2T6R6_9PAST|nr:ROK family protein [Cricetibacter osteomyelitidis]TCP97815.1 putative NBD/HSP70 family sugar kinase [Cricetibacter osteomyelitidis]